MYSCADNLKDFWSNLKVFYVIDHNIVVPSGAATFSVFTHKSIQDRINRMYFYPCFRPFDAYGNNEIRKTTFIQFQVIINNGYEFFQKNSGPITLAYHSLHSILGHHNFQVFEDNWNAPTMKAYGIGWEYRVNGLEVLQITKFTKFMGIELKLPVYEFAYGLDRIMKIAKVEFYNQIDSKYISLVNLFNKFINMDIESLNKKLLQICDQVDISYDNFLLANLIFNVLDSKSYFNIYTKNLYMYYISKTVKKMIINV